MQGLAGRNGPRVARLAAQQRLRAADAAADHVGVERVSTSAGVAHLIECCQFGLIASYGSTTRTRVHTPSNTAGTHFSAGQRLQLLLRKRRSRFAAPLLALPSPRMKSEPLLKGQPPTSPEVFAWRTTAAGAKRHSD